MSGLDDLLRELEKSTAPPVAMLIQFSKVTALKAGMITVDLPGGPADVRYLKQYTPTVGDKAVLLVNAGRVLAIGSI